MYKYFQLPRHSCIIIYQTQYFVRMGDCRAGLKPMQPMQLHWAPLLWGLAPWCLGRLFSFARYTLRLRIQ